MKLTRDKITILLEPQVKSKGGGGGPPQPPQPGIDGEDEFEPEETEGEEDQPDLDDDDQEQSDPGDDIDQIMRDIDPDGGEPIDEVLTPAEGDAIDPEKGKPGEKGDGSKPADGFEGEGPQASERDWADAAKKAGSKMVGGGKGNMMLDAVYNRIKPQQDWKKVLKDLIGKAANEYSLKFGNRRYISSGDYMYHVHQEQNAIDDAIVIIDVSGSVSDNALNLFISETLHIAETKKIKQVTVVFFDHGIQAVHYKVKQKDLLKVTTAARGGTNFKPVYSWLDENEKKLKPGLIMMFTDGLNGDGTIPNPKWSKWFWWVIVDNPGYEHPWGKRVDISERGIEKL